MMKEGIADMTLSESAGVVFARPEKYPTRTISLKWTRKNGPGRKPVWTAKLDGFELTIATCGHPAQDLTDCNPALMDKMYTHAYMVAASRADEAEPVLKFELVAMCRPRRHSMKLVQYQAVNAAAMVLASKAGCHGNPEAERLLAALDAARAPRKDTGASSPVQLKQALMLAGCWNDDDVLVTLRNGSDATDDLIIPVGRIKAHMDCRNVTAVSVRPAFDSDGEYARMTVTCAFADFDSLRKRGVGA